MRNTSFPEVITKLFSTSRDHVACPTITFQVTDDCCLNCSYCYQIQKGHHMMSKQTIKEGMDLLFQMYAENKPDSYINHDTVGLVLEFIGGEPFMNIDTINYGCEYFLNRCLEEEHPWLNCIRFSFSTNGLLYFEPKVQAYLKKFRPFISLNITIDGPERLHDACRKDFDGNGSFSRAMAALNDWHKYDKYPHNKITIAPENLPYLHEIVDFFVENFGCEQIMANPIYEHKWTIEEAQIFYKELKLIADSMLTKQHMDSSLFDPHFGIPLLSTDVQNWCGGTGAMLSFDPDGNAYPCIRYMESSLGSDRKPIIIGNTKGLYQTDEEKQIIKDFKKITRRTQSTDECFNCHIAGGCAWCSAWNYQENGTVDKRSTNICWMHRARSLANTYYWNNYYIKHGKSQRIPVYLERSIATKIIDNEEYDELLKLVY